MRKLYKFVSILMIFVLAFSMSLQVYADDLNDLIDDPIGYYLNDLFEEGDPGTGFTLVCQNCGYSHEYFDAFYTLMCPECGEALCIKNDDDSTTVAVPAKPAPGGVGRKPQGYTSPGTPAVSADGRLSLSLDPSFVYTHDNSRQFDFNSIIHSYFVPGSVLNTVNPLNCVGAFYSFVAPCDGIYYFEHFDFGFYELFSSSWKSGICSQLVNQYKTFTEGDSVSFYIAYYVGGSSALKFTANAVTIFVEPVSNPVTTVNNITTVNNTTIQGDKIYKDTTNNTYYSYTDNACTVYYVDDSNRATSSVTYNEGDENYYVTVYQPVSVTPTTPPSPTTPPGPVTTPDPDAVYNVNVVSVGAWFADFAANIKAYFDGLAAGIAAGFAKLSADFTLAIDKLSINIDNTFNKYMGTPETALPSATPIPTGSPAPSSTPAPSATPEPDEPIVIDKQPVDVSIKTGTNVKYSVEAHSTLDSELSYLWEWSADDGESWRAVTQKVATISTGTNLTMNGRLFRCTISDTLGNSVVSTSALLQVWETEPPEPTATPAPTLAPGQTPAPSTSPTLPLEDEEEVDSIFLQWLRHLIDGAAAATAPLEEVGTVFVEFFAMLPDEVKATLTGALCILLAAGMWKFFGG